MKTTTFFILSFYSALSFCANLNLDPSSLSIKLYKFAVSESTLCTSPVTIFTASTPTYVNMLDSPEFGNGSVTDGTYPCIIIEFSSNIKYIPASDSDNGNCQTSIESTLDVCNSGATSTLIDGTTVTCDSSEERVAMYLSTTSTQTTGTSGHNAFEAPKTANDSTKGFNLGSSLVVDGTSAGVFTVNGSGQVCDGDASGCNGDAGTCEMGPPLFSFTKE